MSTAPRPRASTASSTTRASGARHARGTEAAGKGSRRRGEALTNAIYRATLDELARTSFEELSFDKIAAAAGTGKAALYRRWSTPAELVLAALTDPAAGFGNVPAPLHTGALRDELIALLTHLRRALDQPRGRALRPLIAHRHRQPELFEQVHRLVIRPHVEVFLAVLRQAAERGEVAPERVTERVASVGPRMIILDVWERDQVDPRVVEATVDEILLPLLRARR